MVNENIRRLVVTGKIVELMSSSINNVYTYKVDIKKIDGGVWRIKVDEAIFFKLRKNTEAIFELAMVFKDDNVYGKVNGKLSKVENVRIKGKDVTDEEYNNQVEVDKSWLLNEENLKGIKKKKKSIVALSLGLTYLIAIGLTILAFIMWNDNVDDYNKYEKYIETKGIVVDREKQSSGSTTVLYSVRYTAEDGEVYDIYEKHIKSSSSFAKTPSIGEEVTVIYNPKAYGEGYMAVHNNEFGHYIPLKYSAITKHYIVSIMAIALDLGAIAWGLLLVNQTASRYFRLLIPTGLALWSARTATMCGKMYYIGTFIFVVVFVLMIFVRVKNGFAQKEKIHMSAGGIDI